jgi:hypothetical protein
MVVQENWSKHKTLEHRQCSAQGRGEVKSCRTFHKLLVTYPLKTFISNSAYGMWNLPSTARAKPRQPQQPRHPDATPTPVLGVDRQTQPVCLFVYQTCATTTASKER